MFTRRSAIVRLVLLAGLALNAVGCVAPVEPVAEPVAAPAADGYLFCFWNVENLFDDHDDGLRDADEPYDRWFARDPDSLKLKLDRLSSALVALNGGKGPDILALVEVEGVRAAELLREALNARLADPALHYSNVLMKELPDAGRHIAPVILTRLPVTADRTRLHGRNVRILEGHIVVNGHDLVVIASHWTSRLSDETGERRARYADQIYGVFKGMYRTNPQVDLLVCGDFNDPPEADSVVKHLHATGNREAVRQPGGDPRLFNLLAGKNPDDGFGTHYHRRWYIFDQIVVSPAMLEPTGWNCDPASVQVINTLCQASDPKHRPSRFGNEKDAGPRGWSDHFPVTVRLRVHP